MATTNLGRVVPLYRGEYDDRREYTLNDVVSFGGTVYWHVGKEPTINVPPDDESGSAWSIVIDPTVVKESLPQQNVVVGTSVVSDGDEVSLVSDTVSLQTNEEDYVSNNIPIANTENAGMMSYSDVLAIQRHTQEISVLKGQMVRLLYTASANPSAANIAAFVTSLGYTENLQNIAVIVSATYHVWHYYTNTQVWQDDGIDTVNLWTNSVAGIVRGANVDGKIYAENDGTGSVVGWDALKARVGSLEGEARFFFGTCSNTGAHRTVALSEVSAAHFDSPKDGDILFVRMIFSGDEDIADIRVDGKTAAIPLYVSYNTVTGTKRALKGKMWSPCETFVLCYYAAGQCWIAMVYNYGSTNGYYGRVTLSSSLTSTSESGIAATPKAVKLLNDKIETLTARVAVLEGSN